MHKKLFACLAFLMMMLVSTYGAAQTLNIHKEFAPWERKGSEGDLDQACGSLAISGGTGWLVYEITESPYKKGSLHRATGQYMGSGLFVDFSPYYYPDIILKDEFWPQNTTEPEVAVDGQPRRWHMKVKIGRNLKPFNLKVCWSAPGVRIGGGDYFHQFGQTVDISVTWTPDGGANKPVDNTVNKPVALGRIWHTTETGGWTGTWTRRGTSNVFDVFWVAGSQRVTAVFTMIVEGRTIRIQSRQQSNGHDVDYEGTISPDGRSARGTFRLLPSGTAVGWEARIEY